MAPPRGHPGRGVRPQDTVLPTEFRRTPAFLYSYLAAGLGTCGSPGAQTDNPVRTPFFTVTLLTPASQASPLPRVLKSHSWMGQSQTPDVLQLLAFPLETCPNPSGLLSAQPVALSQMPPEKNVWLVGTESLLATPS